MKINDIINEGKTGPGLWANIHKKQERIKNGSGERMRKPGSKGAPTAQNFKDAASEGVVEGSTTMWEVSFDYGPHMSKTVKVKAGSKQEAKAKVEKAAEKSYTRGIMINWVKPVGQGVAEGSGANKTDLAMAYLKAVVMAPTGTPDKRRILNWQQILDYQFDIEMDTAALAQMLPQFDSMLQAGKLDKLQDKMARRGELEIGESQQGVAEGWKQKVGAGLTAAAMAAGANGVVLNPARPIGPKGQTVANPYPNKAANTKSTEDDAWAKIEKRKAAEKKGVAEGSNRNDDIARLKSGDKTSDGIGMQDIRLMAGEGKLTKRTVLQALAAIRKQRSERSVAEADKHYSNTKNPVDFPKTWHDVDKKLGKAVDKMSQAEKVKKGFAHPDTLKKKGVAGKGSQLEETYHDDDEFFEAYGVMEYNDEMINEAEYQGRKVTLNKPMRGDVAKFKVFVRDPKTGNVKKVNFGQKGARIKKHIPGRRKNFRARHNCDNPGPKTSARYWSCRNW